MKYNTCTSTFKDNSVVRKKTMTLLILVLLAFGASSQMNSRVYLQNGSILKGEVLKNDETGVRVRTRDGSYWNFSAEEVVSVEKYSPTVSRTGFYNRTSLGVIGGDFFSPSLHIVNGYSFNSHWEAGFGLGVEAFTWNGGYVPLFLEGRYTLLEGRTSPFVSVMAGYEMPTRSWSSNKGGFTTGLQLGMTHYFSDHVGIVTSIGYRFAYLEEENMWWDDFETIRLANRYEIRFGFVFR
jgi:hypothetical protein